MQRSHPGPAAEPEGCLGPFCSKPKGAVPPQIPQPLTLTGQPGATDEAGMIFAPFQHNLGSCHAAGTVQSPPVLGAGRVGCRDADLLGGTRTAAEKPLFALKPQLSLAFVKRRAWKTVGRRGPARGSVAASGPSPAAGEGFIAATDRRGVCKILQKSRFFKNQPRTPGGALRPEAGQSPGRKRESAGRAGGGPPDPAALQRRW